jgi:putative transcriptional regulator
MARGWMCFLSLLITAAAWAQQDAPNALLLIAKPGLPDPNFSETVVLVTQSVNADTVGVVLNRPISLHLEELAPQLPGAARYKQPLHAGGPVMRQVIVALFRSEDAPKAAAFHVLKNLYLSMHPANISALLEQPGQRFRLFAGFSGWAPGQLESEMRSDTWYVLPAREELLFRKDTSGMWRELVEKVRGGRAAVDSATAVDSR